MLFKRKRIPFTIPDDARELTEEEMILVNGGAEEKKEMQTTAGDSVTVKDGDTLGKIVGDYNKTNGTNYTIKEVAEKSGKNQF